MTHKITVFTPAYNRANLLQRCFESMKRQTNQDFVWMVIDDGSVDNTRELCEEWICENHEFSMEYYYKENGGLHTAYNEAILHLNTELSVCLDSDDWMPDDAIERILNFWDKYGSDEYAGIVGLDCYADGAVIGDKLPECQSINLIDLMTGKYHIKDGDRKIIVRSDFYKMVAPMPIFNEEKNFNPHYMHLQISLRYDFLIMNESVCFVEYQSDGMSRNIFKQYLDSPNSFAQLRRLCMQFQRAPLLFKIKNAIHYDSSCILAGHIQNIWKESVSPLLTCSMLAPGAFLSILTRIIVEVHPQGEK